MKKIPFVAVVLLVAACSSNKYATHFRPGHSGNSYSTVEGSGLAPVEAGSLFASASEGILPVTGSIAPPVSTAVKPVKKTYIQMTKTEKKNFRKQLKADVRKYINKREGMSPPAGEWGKWDQDLKMAAIFGAIGTTGLIIGAEPFFIIGAIALIIGVVFLVKWLVRQ